MPSSAEQLSEFLEETWRYYDKRLTPDQAKPYLASLKRHDIDRLKEARQQHYEDPQRGQFIPKIADLARGLKNTARGRETSAPRPAPVPETPYHQAKRHAQRLYAARICGRDVADQSPAYTGGLPVAAFVDRQPIPNDGASPVEHHNRWNAFYRAFEDFWRQHKAEH